MERKELINKLNKLAEDIVGYADRRELRWWVGIGRVGSFAPTVEVWASGFDYYDLNQLWVFARDRFGENGFQMTVCAMYDDQVAVVIWPKEGENIKKEIRALVERTRKGDFSGLVDLEDEINDP